LDISEDDFVLINSGLLSEWKNQLDFLKAVSCLPKNSLKKIRCIFTSTGSSEYLSQMQAYLDHRPYLRSRVRFEHQTDAQLDYFYAADAAVACSNLEGYCFESFYSMQFGLPLLVSKNSGRADLAVNFCNAFVYEPGNISELTKDIDRLMNDAPFRSLLGKNSFDRFGAINTFKKYCLLFEQMIREAAATSKKENQVIISDIQLKSSSSILADSPVIH